MKKDNDIDLTRPLTKSEKIGMIWMFSLFITLGYSIVTLIMATLGKQSIDDAFRNAMVLAVITIMLRSAKNITKDMEIQKDEKKSDDKEVEG